MIVEEGAMRCRNCGDENPSGGRFCQRCGSELDSKGQAHAAARVPAAQEKVLTARILVLFVLAILFAAMVPLASASLMSVRVEEQTITVEPGSYEAMRFAFYGYGTFEYSYEKTGEGSMYLIELDSRNYERFVSDEPYDYLRYTSLGGHGGGGSARSGMLWVKYVVLVNDGYVPASVEFEAEGKALASLLVAGPLLLVEVAIGLSILVAPRLSNRHGAARKTP